VRSYNNSSGVGSRLVITLFAQQLSRDVCGVDDNRLSLAGVLCKNPVYRRTPLGREIADLLLAVNRPYGRSDYLPCIAWGALAQRCARMTTGTGLRLQGRLQSRAYTKVIEGGSVKRVAFEVSIMTLEVVDWRDALPETVEEL
jgi:single-stranded DNA-binding protein